MRRHCRVATAVMYKRAWNVFLIRLLATRSKHICLLLITYRLFWTRSRELVNFLGNPFCRNPHRARPIRTNVRRRTSPPFFFAFFRAGFRFEYPSEEPVTVNQPPLVGVGRIVLDEFAYRTSVRIKDVCTRVWSCFWWRDDGASFRVDGMQTSWPNTLTKTNMALGVGFAQDLKRLAGSGAFG